MATSFSARCADRREVSLNVSATSHRACAAPGLPLPCDIRDNKHINFCTHPRCNPTAILPTTATTADELRCDALYHDTISVRLVGHWKTSRTLCAQEEAPVYRAQPVRYRRERPFFFGEKVYGCSTVVHLPPVSYRKCKWDTLYSVSWSRGPKNIIN